MFGLVHFCSLALLHNKCIHIYSRNQNKKGDINFFLAERRQRVKVNTDRKTTTTAICCRRHQTLFMIVVWCPFFLAKSLFFLCHHHQTTLRPFPYVNDRQKQHKMDHESFDRLSVSVTTVKCVPYLISYRLSADTTYNSRLNRHR